MSLTSTDGGGRLVYGADCRPTDDLVEFAPGRELMLVEATLPRPERDGRARAPHPGRGRRARARRGRRAARARAHLRRARPRVGAPAGGREVRRAGRGGHGGRRLRGLSRTSGRWRPYSRRPWPAPGTCSQTSSGCAGRSTSSSATSSSARPDSASGGFSPAVDVYYVDDPPRAVVKADLAGVDIQDVGARDPRPAAPDRRRAPPGGGRRAASTSRSRSSTARSGGVVELGAEVAAEAGARELRGRDPRGGDPARARRTQVRAPRADRRGRARVSIHIPSADGEAAQAIVRTAPARRRCRSCRCGTACPSRTRSLRSPSGRSARSSS